MTDAQIILLRPDPDEAPLRTKPRSGYCRHTKVELDTDAKRVYCRDCGSEVPAFEHLLFLAHDFEHFLATRNEAKRQAKVEYERLDDLKRKIANAKATLRRAVVKREADLPNDWWREFDRAMRRGHERREHLSPEAIERIALIHAEYAHPGGRDA